VTNRDPAVTMRDRAAAGEARRRRTDRATRHASFRAVTTGARLVRRHVLPIGPAPTLRGMSRVLVIARADVKRSHLCAALAHSGYEAVAVESTAAFRASGDWSLYDCIVLEPQPRHPDGDRTLLTYIQRFDPALVTLDARWSPAAVRMAVERRRHERAAHRGTRRKPADYYGTPTDIAAVELIVLASALSPVPRATLAEVVRTSGFPQWSGRMVKYVLRRLEHKAELRADEVTGSYQTTESGRFRVTRAASGARSA
jgi:hypothetical protein